MKEKLIFIFTESLSHTGLGHLGRCTALAEILIESGYYIEMILHSDGTGIGNNTNFPIHVLDWKNPEVLNNLLEKNNISFAFVDSYLADEKIYRVISNRVMKLISIDDTNRIAYPVGSTILNPGFGGNYIEYDKDKNTVLSGVKYVLLRKPFRENFTIPDLSENIQSVLVMVGGEDRLNLVPKILVWLKEKYPQWKKQIVIGPAFKNLDSIQESKDENTFLYKNIDAFAMRDLMLSVDLAITAGGQTTYELASCGVPMVIVEVADNQKKNIQGFSELGVPNLLGYKDEFNLFNKFTEIVSMLLSKEKRIAQREQFIRIKSNRLSQLELFFI